jgi:hypothetical protein
MERSVDDTASSRLRERLASITGPWEVAAVTAGAVAVWRLALGWDWSSVPPGDPLRTVAAQSGFDWLLLCLAVAAGVGWLAWRGFVVAGTVSIWSPIIVLSGWRLAASGILGWPTSLAALIFMVSAVCIVAAATGTWLRHRAERRFDEAVASAAVAFDDADIERAAAEPKPVDRPVAAPSPTGPAGR